MLDDDVIMKALLLLLLFLWWCSEKSVLFEFAKTLSKGVVFFF